MHSIDIDVFDPKSIDRAISEINRFIDHVKRCSEKVADEVGKYVEEQAALGFKTMAAIYDGDSEITVGRDTEQGETIVYAEDPTYKSTAFIEFGTGVFNNGAESYPGQRPEGIVGIGEYGKGRGKRNGWVYQSDGKGTPYHRKGVVYPNLRFTRGVPAGACMWTAASLARKNMVRIARGVFENDSV